MLSTLPVPQAIRARFKGELVRKSIHGTAAIEGNPLNEDDVARILEQGDDFAPVNDREREIANLLRAYERFAQVTKADAPLVLDEDLIREMHALITDGLAVRDNIRGQYRNIRVEAGDDEHEGKYTPPEYWRTSKR
jgi:Fic family protein